MRRSHRLWRAVRPAHLAWQRLRGRTVWKGGPPHGFFSEAEAIRRGEVEGGILPPEILDALPPASEVIAAGLGQEGFGAWDCVWSLRGPARLIAPGLPHLDHGGRACLEAMHGPHHLTDPVFRRGKTECKPVMRLDLRATSILSRWNDGSSYYHWFLDGLTRLIHLERFPDDTVILVPERLTGFARRSLERLNLTQRVRSVSDVDCEIASYAFAGPTMLSGCPDPRGVTWLRRRFMTGEKDAPTRRLYLERKAERRTCHNASAVAKVFAKRGWEVVDPGSLDLDGQIRLFGQASRIVGLHGAALTNLLWMPAGGKVLEIMPARRRNGCYAGIAHCSGIGHQAWVLPSDRMGNLEIPLDPLRRKLDEWED